MATSCQTLLYYADLICEKIKLHKEANDKRILAFRKGNYDEAEFIEKMQMEPIDIQYNYLLTKALSLFKKGGQNG